MINIEVKDKLNEELYIMLGSEFEKFAIKNDVVCGYKPVNFVAKDGDNIIGMITGHSYYNEAHIGDLIVLEQYRNKHIGTKLVEAFEDYCKGTGVKNINLTTYNFQAPDFYQKCGFKIEFIREDKENAKLTKYFLIKYL